MQEDIRWQQRFNNYKKAFSQLQKFVEKEELSELEEQGLIKAFEYTWELAWNTMKDYLEYQGITNLTGSRDTIRESFKAGLISGGDVWMDMLRNRNRTSHVYNEDTAKEISTTIRTRYYDLFLQFKEDFEKLLLK